MPGTPKREGPEFIAATSENVFNPAAGTYAVITHIHMVNQDASARTVNAWIGATGAEADGTEIFEDLSIAANSTYDYYTRTFMSATDFLVMLASAASMVVVTIDYESYVA
jgi:hypothetical protein